MSGESTETAPEATAENQVNPLALSDEDFMKANGDVLVAAEDPSDAEIEKVEVAPAAEATVEATPAAEAGDAGQVKDPDKPVEAAPAAAPAPAGDKPAEELKPVEGADTNTAVETPTPVNYQAGYDSLMAPLQANGKSIEIRTPEEARALMSMGANYTKKMQEIAPHRKVLTMLQNNGLLDESKLSFLIDLDKKDPEAIKKLLKDSGTDPLEIDVTGESQYREGNHRVSDEEVSFTTALEELSSTPVGQETLQAISNRWDDASKAELWKNPGIMAVIHDQRAAGVYDRVVAEMDRRVTLGTLPPGTTFLRGYKIVGDELTEANAFEDLKPAPAKSDPPVSEAKPKEEPVVVATRVETPKSPVTNDDKASAAATSRSTPAAAKEVINWLAMADDAFLKEMDGRV